MPAIVIYITSTMLLLGAAPLPYGYYTLLRIVVTGVFIWAMFVSFERKYGVLPWVFGLGAILFNPLIKIHLPKELWMVLDVATGIFLLVVKGRIEESASTDSE